MTESRCGWCLDPVEPGAEADCEVCGAVHHHSCATSAGRCSTTGCAGLAFVPARLVPGPLGRGRQAPAPRPVAPAPLEPTIPRPANLLPEQREEGVQAWQTPQESAPTGRPASPGFHFGAALLGPIWGFGHSPATGLWVSAVYAILYGLGGFSYGWLAHLLLGVVGWEVGWRDHSGGGSHPAHYHTRERAWTIAAWVLAGVSALVYLLSGS